MDFCKRRISSFLSTFFIPLAGPLPACSFDFISIIRPLLETHSAQGSEAPEGWGKNIFLDNLYDSSKKLWMFRKNYFKCCRICEKHLVFISSCAKETQFISIFTMKIIREKNCHWPGGWGFLEAGGTPSWGDGTPLQLHTMVVRSALYHVISLPQSQEGRSFYAPMGFGLK